MGVYLARAILGPTPELVAVLEQHGGAIAVEQATCAPCDRAHERLKGLHTSRDGPARAPAAFGSRSGGCHAGQTRATKAEQSVDARDSENDGTTHGGATERAST
jgi:hypothetical protein